MRSSESKILSRADLMLAVVHKKQREETLVLANGCFDVLHAGHVRYLEAARNEGDILIVGVNGDATARALKGVGRPILDSIPLPVARYPRG